MSEETVHKILIWICWIFFFPIMLSVVILKSERLETYLKVLFLLGLWFGLYAIARLI